MSKNYDGLYRSIGKIKLFHIGWKLEIGGVNQMIYHEL